MEFWRKLRKYGFGLRLTATRVRSWRCIWATAVAQVRRALWQALPPVYRQYAVCYTDAWEAYQGVFLTTRHRVVAKACRGTNHLELWFNTLRQRLSRFVRKSSSFSKKFANYLGALWLFVHHYNASLCA